MRMGPGIKTDDGKHVLFVGNLTGDERTKALIVSEAGTFDDTAEVYLGQGSTQYDRFRANATHNPATGEWKIDLDGRALRTFTPQNPEHYTYSRSGDGYQVELRS